MTRLPERVFAELYEAFRKQPCPTSIAACPCCLDPPDLRELLTRPHREVTVGALGKYAARVFLTVGDEPDFRYFLPRILEVLATEATWWPGPEIVGRAMAKPAWLSYTGSQRAAIANYFHAVFGAVFVPPLDGYEIDSWLCCASRLPLDWDVLLERLIAHPTALLALYDWHAERLQKHELGNGFWDDSPKKDTFLAWMLSDRVMTILWQVWDESTAYPKIAPGRAPIA